MSEANYKLIRDIPRITPDDIYLKYIMNIKKSCLMIAVEASLKHKSHH